MKSAIIHALPDWDVTSWGNGLAYSINHKPSGESVFFHGEAADLFREEFADLTERAPCLNYADALAIIFAEHEGIAA